MLIIILFSYFLGFAAEPTPTPGATPAPTPKGEPKKEKAPIAPPRLESTKKSKSSSTKGSAKTTTTSAVPSPSPFLAEEATNLIIPNQKYVLKFEDEESFGKIQSGPTNAIGATFSPQEVETFQKSIQYITEYRNQMKHRCFGESSRKMNEALEKYLAGLCQFNRKALPMVADITENNSAMILVVNRSTLIDAPVLISRYFQFKKQRYKENMQKFLKDDNKLVSQMAQVAKVFKIDLNDDTWNKTYGLRENGLESISQWPRELVFQATEKLAAAKENACIVNINSDQETKLAE